jgi:hypothetical protein
MQRTLKRELKVLEIVKREHLENPIRSFSLLKLKHTLFDQFNSFFFETKWCSVNDFHFLMNKVGNFFIR